MWPREQLHLHCLTLTSCWVTTRPGLLFMGSGKVQPRELPDVIVMADVPGGADACSCGSGRIVPAQLMDAAKWEWQGTETVRSPLAL